MPTAKDWIKKLDLEPHVEGGYFRRTDTASQIYMKDGEEFPIYTNIYFLLTPESPSHFHQLTSDEMWFYHAGNPLTVHSLHEDGTYTAVELGLEEEQTPHHTVRAGTIFGSTVEEGYALVSCAVIPGFSYSDFKLFTQEELLKTHSNHQEIIKKLAYETLPEE